MGRRKSDDKEAVAMKDKEDQAINDTDSTDVESGEDGEKKTVPYFRLFRFADGWDYLALIVGSIAAVGHGVLTPLFVIFFGDVLDEFGSDNNDDLSDAVATVAYYILYVAAAGFVLSYFQVSMFTLAAQRQSLRIRKLYFTSLCRQDMAWYDTHSTAAMSSRVATDVPKIQEGMGDKVGSFLQYTGMFLGGFIVGFVYGWKLTLVILSVMPLVVIGGAVMGKLIGDAASGGSGFYAEAGAVADEVLRMIRTVIAFGTQKYEKDRYYDKLDEARRAGEFAGRAQGLGMGFTFFIIFGSYALAFLYGSKLVRDGELTAGDVITVFFAVVIGAMSIGQGAPNISAMSAAQGAAYKIFQVIDRKSEIDSLSEDGKMPKKVTGKIEFTDVHFSYPTRKHETVLNGLDINILPQETVALVGESGCGKSTVLSLLERFYDPDSGKITLDGVPLKDLNIQWLRSRIALVEQMPVLFPTTIYENIALGKDGATREEVIEAAKAANAHNFIEGFPNKYDTLVGDSGTQMSGGQRQRIAIARALIKNPDILLLDEATSALDNESEAIVKEALDNAAKGRTTIVIAHRLSTVFDADRIVVIGEGKVVEHGTPQELLDQQGAFARMVASQHGHHASSASNLHGRLSLDATNNPSKGDSNGDLLVSEAGNGDLDDNQEKSVSPDASPVSSPTSKRKSKTKAAEGLGKDAELSEEVKKRYLEEVPDIEANMFKWVFGLNKPELCYIIFGVAGAVTEGLIWAVYAILLAEVLSEMLSSNDPDIVLHWSMGFLAAAALAFLSQVFKFWFLAIAGERLTKRLREMAFHAIINKDASWFDMPQHERGILTTRLSSDAYAVKGIMGDRLAMLCMSAATIVGGLTISLAYCWRVGLVVIACIPIVGVGGALQFKMVTGFASGKEFELSGKFASQAVENIRTVAALGRLDNFVRDYFSTLVTPSRKMKITAQVQGIAFGFTEFCMFAIWSLSFWYGSEVVEDGHCTFDEMFKSQMAIVFMGIIVGQVSALAPDYAKANDAAKRLYHLITTQKKEEENKPKLDKPPISGNIELQDVEFTYPARPDAPVLRGLSLSVQPGQTVALVGKSGCGKSTVISLLEGYYKVDGGKILIDGNDMTKIDETHLRKHIGLVTQQPELFACSIRDNIRYGLEREVSDEEIKEAAKKANALDFIMEFDKGFDTMVGEKGAQLSGGQRQRVAIARALIRADDIKILLLDEASAALDSESEKLVHDALERARKGRTTIIVAHRLSTIKTADKICVIDKGVVKEQGTHDELLAQQGAYYELVNKQQFVTYDEEESSQNDGSNGMPPSAGSSTVNDASSAHAGNTTDDDGRSDADADYLETAPSSYTAVI